MGKVKGGKWDWGNAEFGMREKMGTAPVLNEWKRVILLLISKCGLWNKTRRSGFVIRRQ
jgi:hypothetical protein